MINHHPKNRKTLGVFSLKLKTRERCLLLQFLINCNEDFTWYKMTKKKETKDMRIRKEEIKLPIYADDMIISIETPP